MPIVCTGLTHVSATSCWVGSRLAGLDWPQFTLISSIPCSSVPLIFQQASPSLFLWWLSRVSRKQIEPCRISGEPSKLTQYLYILLTWTNLTQYLYILLTKTNQKPSQNSKFKGKEINLSFLIVGIEKPYCKGARICRKGIIATINKNIIDHKCNGRCAIK